MTMQDFTNETQLLGDAFLHIAKYAMRKKEYNSARMAIRYLQIVIDTHEQLTKEADCST